MNISIKIDQEKFRTRKSLVVAKKEPSEKSKKNKKKIIGYKQDGHYFVAVTKE